MAKELELQPDTVATCLNTERYSEEVAKDLHDAFALGTTSTPTFVINGHPLVRARPFAEFQALIDELLKQQPPPQSCFPTCKISASCPTL